MLAINLQYSVFAESFLVQWERHIGIESVITVIVLFKSHRVRNRRIESWISLTSEQGLGVVLVVVLFRIDIGIAIFVQLLVQFIDTHPACIQGVAEPTGIIDCKLHWNYRVGSHCTSCLDWISFTVPFGHFIHFRKGEVFRTVQLRKETCFVITEFRVGKLAYIAGTRFGKYRINGKWTCCYIKSSSMRWHAVRIGQHTQT